MALACAKVILKLASTKVFDLWTIKRPYILYVKLRDHSDGSREGQKQIERWSVGHFTGNRDCKE